MRNFGTEQVSCTATIYSYSTNPESVGKKVLAAFHGIIDKAFKDTVVRHDAENAYIAQINKAKDEKIKAIKKQ